MNKKIVKINFCDFWPYFTIQDSLIYKILTKKYKVEISDIKPDFLFYSCFGNNNMYYSKCTKIFVTAENIVPNFNKCDYSISPHYINFDNRHFRFPPYYYKENIRKYNKQNLIEPEKRKFCNFVYRNANIGIGAILRKEFCIQLSKYKHIDCPSDVLKNMFNVIPPRKNWLLDKQKINFLKNYKFTIAFENTKYNGYTTEKLTDAFMAFSVPIYWGNPLVNIEFNHNAFINCNDFSSADECIEYIKEVDKNDKLYLDILDQIPLLFNFEKLEKDFEQYIYKIIDNGNYPYEKDIINRERIMYHI